MTDLSKLGNFGSSERDALIEEIVKGPDRVTASIDTIRRQMEMHAAAERRANRPAELLEAAAESSQETNSLLRQLLAAQNQTNQLLQDIKDGFIRSSTTLDINTVLGGPGGR